MQLKTITYATHDEGYFSALKKSAERYNYDLVVLGWNEEWKGLMSKIYSMYNYVETLDNDTIVLFIDGYDTILANDADLLVDYFKSFNTRILFFDDYAYSKNNEYNTNNLISILVKKYNGNQKGITIWTGAYMGYKNDILNMLKKMIKFSEITNINHSDQYILNQIYTILSNYKIDQSSSCAIGFLFCDFSYYFGLIFTNNVKLNWKKLLYLKNKKIYNKLTNKSLFIFSPVNMSNIDDMCVELDLPLYKKRKNIVHPTRKIYLCILSIIMLFIIYKLKQKI